MQGNPTFSLLNVDHVALNKSWNYNNVISPFYRIYLIDDGIGHLSNPDQSLTLERGYLYLIPSFTIVNQTCPSQLSQYYVHFLETTLDGSSMFAYCRRLMKVQAVAADLRHFKRLLELNPGRDLRKSDNPKVYEKTKTLNDFIQRNANSPLATLIETQGIIMVLLSRFLATPQFSAQRISAIPSKFAGVINYIQTNLPLAITVEDLAGMANLSVDYFSRSFLTHTGLRPIQFIHQKRIERAQFLILTTDMPFASIASETGFESLSYFSRIFKSMTGQSPGQYRNAHLNGL